MDQSTRNTLRNVVTQCRKLLEESVAQVLQGQFGIYAGAKKDEVQIEPEARMSHLSEEDRAYRQDLLDHYEHIKALGYKAKDALAQLIREVAFTHLNRFCAYRMMESRGLIRESVSKGLKSQGFLFYLADHEEDERRFNTGQQDVAYRHFLNWLGGTLSEEIGVLFAPTDPANRLYPPQRVIDQVLGLLNDPELVGIWSEDEAIGWVYQYFTPKELRDQARKESQAPRNSYELAFRNQFFTPRYVVEFLTDNTLGRIWYEMRQGHTRLKDQCRYMVRRPSEVFLNDGEAEPKDAAKATDDLSQEELLKLPVYVPFRAKKDPRDFRILDPACGSGHFLLYCFDLLLTIYEEAYSDPDLGPALKKDYPTLEDLRRDVPRLILAHNLHGIDIDPRASQIAALALWLRCQRAYQDIGIKQDRPKITRSNIVCAEPMPGEETLLKEFVSQLEPKLLGQLVQAVFDELRVAGDAGALLPADRHLRTAVAKARADHMSAPHAVQTLLFENTDPRTARHHLSEKIDDDFFVAAEARVFSALHDYAHHATATDALRTRLFSDDTAQGFAFLDVCRNRYDAILMNPPFGKGLASTEALLASDYSDSRTDIYAAFVERGISLLCDTGMLGALTSRTGLFLSSLREWRSKCMLTEGHVTCLADLGMGVLDTAMVETAAYCISRSPAPRPIFFKVSAVPDRAVALKQMVHKGESKHVTDAFSGLVFTPAAATFKRLPGFPFAYWVTPALLKAFETMEPLEPAAGVVRVGLQTDDDFRFVRLWTEVPTETITSTPKRASVECRWVHVLKGDSATPFYADIPTVVDWQHHAEEGYRYARNSDLYGSAGLSWSVRTRLFQPSAVPGGCIFTISRYLLIPQANPLALLGLLNTPVATALLRLSSERFEHPKFIAGTVQLMPIPRLSTEQTDTLASFATEAIAMARQIASSDETSHDFVSPALTRRPIRGLDERICEVVTAREAIVTRGSAVRQALDTLAASIYGVGSADLEDLATLRIGDESPEDEEADPKGDKTDGDLPTVQHTAPADLVRDLLSWVVGVLFGRWDIRVILDRVTPASCDASPFSPIACHSPGMLRLNGDGPDQSPKDYPIDIDWDGIACDESGHPDDMATRVEGVLEHVGAALGEIRVSHLSAIIGIKDLRSYLRKPGKGGFWDDHISRYSKSRRKAPIYWLLQSSKKNYAIWIYYHRLDKDILFKALVNYVEPKIRLETDRLGSLRAQKGEGGKATKKLDKEIEKQEEFLSELRDFEEKLRRAAELRLVPDLNDGVVLNIAPLHELVPWKEAEKYWEELLEGKYEWSSIGKQLREKGVVK